jgi:TPR repeat protein
MLYSLAMLALLLLGLSGGASAQSPGEARELALTALRLEFERDGLAATESELEARFAKACERGYSVACRRSTWLVDGKPDFRKVQDVFTPSCEAGDDVACLVMGWALDAIASRIKDVDLRDKTWREAARQLKSSCLEGYQPACHDYAGFLYANKGVESPPDPALRRWKDACDAREYASCTQLARLHLEGGSGVAPNRATAQRFAATACTGGYPDGCAVLGAIDDSSWAADKLDKFYGGLCDQGHRDSCWRLARSYYDGVRPEPTPGRLQALFERGCELRHARSCFEAGRWQIDHGGEVATAAQRFGRACNLGDAAGCSAQVDLILSERTPGSVKDAYHAFDVACEAGQSLRACLDLALALIEGEQIPRNAERGRTLLMRVCTDESSDPKACTALGESFEEGLGGERDRTKASSYYRWACAANVFEACKRRGDLLVSDVGVRRDDHEALNMYERACEGKIALACNEAARILYEGTFVKQDLARAASLYSQGCQAGEPQACFGLGQVLERGPGATPDMKSAREAYTRAVELGSLDAKRSLARLLWNGFGGSKQKGRAKQLCREACQGGDAVACRGPAFLKN